MDPLAELAGTSPVIAAVREQVRRLLSSQTGTRRLPPLLLLGETGTGKGLLARACHRAGPRANGPFVSLNCAAIPETLLEAELFGFDRGAFTGADYAKSGLFQSAHDGTIFLDEIGLLAEPLQAKLLTFLDDRTVRRLGSRRLEPVDVWVMAATSTDLKEAVQTGRFREDLYHRLAVLPIQLPPLRDRGEDVVLLAEQFLAKACQDYGLPAKTLTASARGTLLGHRWSGNVRELANVMERAALLCGEDEVRAETLGLPGVPVAKQPSASGTETAAADTVAATPPYRASLDQLERAQLLEVLRRTDWNVSRAAEQLGMPRNTLRYRIARYGLSPDASRSRRREPRLGRPGQGQALGGLEPAAASLRRQRAVSFLRVEVVGPTSVELRWASTDGFDRIAEKIETFGGRVIRRDTAWLDGAFGLEPAEDAPDRAANAALAIRRLMERAQADHAAARITTTIETVSCLLEEREGQSQIASEALQDIDDTLTALTTLATADAIIVGPRAAPHLERHFTLAAANRSAGEKGPTRLKGRESPEDERTRARAAESRVSPFVGRSQEVVFLEQRLRQVAETRRGHIVGLMGEPGMGKSRLLAEFGRVLISKGVPVIEGHCFSHATATPYSLLLDLVRRSWRLDESDTPEALAAAIHQRLSALGEEEGSAPVLLTLLGLRSDVLGDLSPAAVKARTFDLFRRLLLAHAEPGPLVLLLEDLHWVDQTSQEFFGGFADSLPGSAVLVVTTMRPGFRAPWLDRSWSSQLGLPALSLEDSVDIVHALRPDLPRSTADVLASRAEGNPFFLEELTRALVDDVSVQVVVPGTITDVIQARMDRLPPAPRRLLETAAVLGREAPLSLLESVTSTPASALATPLGHLVAAEFLFEQPGPTFVFKHALIQDVAYDRLAPLDRARLHAAAGQALERLYTDRTDEVLDRIAHHFGHTNDHVRAIGYLRRLGERAIGSDAPSEALTALEQALRTGEQLREGRERERTVLSTVTEFAVPLILLGRVEEVKTLLLQYRSRIERLDEPDVSGPFFVSLAFAYDHTGAHRQGEALALRGLESATRVGDEMTKGKALMVLTFSSLWTGRFTEGIERAERAIGALTEPGSLFWRGLTYWGKAHHEVLLGHLDAALRSGDSQREIGQRSENLRTQSYGTCMLGWIAILRGEIESGLELCEKAVEMAPDHMARMVVMGYLGEALEAAGRYDDAREQLVGSVEFGRRIDFPQVVAWNLTRMSAAERGAGDLRRAHILAEEALGLARAVEFSFAEALALRALGLAADAERQFDAAVDHLSGALARLTAISARYHAAIVRLELAVPLAQAGRLDEATIHLADAEDNFRGMAVPVWAERAATLARELGLDPGRRPRSLV